MTPSPRSDLHGLTVISFESRRAGEMAELIRRYGGLPVVAPSMRELPLSESPEALHLLEELRADRLDVLILLTGVGVRTLTQAVASECSAPQLAALLRRVALVARGPKPVAALRELGLTPQITVPEPNTWREILATLDGQVPVRERCVAVLEYGRPNTQLLQGLAERGAAVLRVPLYRWALPEDVGPLRLAIRRLADGTADVVLFTSAQQVDHVVRMAEELGLRPMLARSVERLVVGSIGPVCSEALRSHGLPVDLEPSHPKMGRLVSTAAESAAAILARKRSTA